MMRSFAKRMLPLLAAWLVTGCATTSQVDPLEPINRVGYAIHEPIDRVVVRPVIEAYIDLVPRTLRQIVTNFHNNIDDFFSGVNGMLQGKLDKAGHDFGRVTVNSLFGIGGLIDFASEAGIPRGNEDFGQTFGHWGIPQGPYLFVPLFGPTTARDGTGFVVRVLLGPANHISDDTVRWSLWAMGYVDARAQALEGQTLAEKAALDPYTFIRRSYLQRREYLTYDGSPPPEKDED